MRKKRKITTGEIVLFLILLMLAITTAIPVLFVFTTAFTDESVLASEGYRLLPSALSLDGFRAVLIRITCYEHVWICPEQEGFSVKEVPDGISHDSYAL